MRKLEALDLNRLLVLHWLLEDANVTQAAAHLGTTQPAVSRTLRDLRHWFDDPLLVRSGRGLTRTPIAEALRPRLAHIIFELRELVQPPTDFEPASAQGAVRICCTDYVATLVMLAWDQHVAPFAPGLDLELVTPAALNEKDLESGALDFAVLPTRGPQPDSGLAHLTWYQDRYATLVRADHPLAGKRIGPKRFAALEHIQVVTGLRGRSEMDTYFRKQGLQRRVVLRVGTFVLAVHGLRASDRVATLPSRVSLTATGPLAEIHTPLDLPPFTLDLIFHPRMSLVGRHRFLRDALLREPQPVDPPKRHSR